MTIWPDTSNNGIRIEPGASVNLILVDGAKLIVWGAGAYEAMPGSATIQLPEGSSLNVSGRGTLIAQVSRWHSVRAAVSHARVL